MGSRRLVAIVTLNGPSEKMLLRQTNSQLLGYLQSFQLRASEADLGYAPTAKLACYQQATTEVLPCCQSLNS